MKKLPGEVYLKEPENPFWYTLPRQLICALVTVCQ